MIILSTLFAIFVLITFFSTPIFLISYIIKRLKKTEPPASPKRFAISLLVFFIASIGFSSTVEPDPAPVADQIVASDEATKEPLETKPEKIAEPEPEKTPETVALPVVAPVPATNNATPENKVQATPEPAPVPTAPEPTPEPAPEPVAKESTVSYVASSDSDKFHKPGCRHAQKITDSNKVSFSSKEDAANAGYVACKVCNP